MPSTANPWIYSSFTTATAGTASALNGTTPLLAYSVTIIARPGNGSNVFVGGSDVNATVNQGLRPGDSLKITPREQFLDVNKFFIDVATSGNGVDWYAEKA